LKQFNADNISVINRETTLFWFRRDLRVDDNAGLYHALKDFGNVLPIFIFDTTILNKLEDRKDRRLEFILHSLTVLQEELVEKGSSLLVLYGDPVEVFARIQPKAVYTNTDYEPYAIQRDKAVASLLEKNGVPFLSFKDHVVFHQDEVLKSDGKPYTVFTPYARQWKKKLSGFYYKSYPTRKYLSGLRKLSPLPLPSLEDIGFEASGAALPERIIRKSIIKDYDKTRNIPSLHGTTRLGVHLRFGTVSIRQLVKLAVSWNEVWLNELIWRDFFSMILYYFPNNDGHAFKPAYDKIEWRNNEEEFASWCEGKTGYPLVDAGMRELNATGFMHNRVRMVTASFLTKHLLIDWRWGEAYFAKKLMDFDLASNNGGWQWAAGSGCDAAPYFRVFNPLLQAEKFDPEEKYIKKWIPEYGSKDYPGPIVEHVFARDRVLKAYKEALG
jgi:deoxyribodipyrimidine photo-lyase